MAVASEVTEDVLAATEPQITPSIRAEGAPEVEPKPATSSKPVVIEFVSSSAIEPLMMSIGAAVNKWLEVQALDCPLATIWSQCRAGDAHLLTAHDGKKVFAVSFWRLEQWNAGTVYRCIGHGSAPGWSTDWITGFIDVAKARGEACSAMALVWEAREVEKLVPANVTRARESLVIYLGNDNG